jgi:hypothetical protein
MVRSSFVCLLACHVLGHVIRTKRESELSSMLAMLASMHHAYNKLQYIRMTGHADDTRCPNSNTVISLPSGSYNVYLMSNRWKQDT